MIFHRAIIGTLILILCRCLTAFGQTAAPAFTCGQDLFDSRDSSTYQTVQIGTQCWMADNLNTGNRISLVKDQRDNGIIEKYCYDNLDANCDVYGGLYQWNELMAYSREPGARGICPEGFHVPTEEEWCTLTTYLDSTVDCGFWGATGEAVGTMMRTAGTLESKTGLWHFGKDKATNESGFNGLPAGTRSVYTKFFFLGYHGYFWTSSEKNEGYAWFRYLKYSNGSIYREDYLKDSGYSVRCIWD